MMMKGCSIHKTAFLLVVIGALNWGLVGVGGWNVVNLILGGIPTLERLVYVLVGLSGIAMLTQGTCKMCKMAGESGR